MATRIYYITLDTCDASTQFDMELTDEEARFLRAVAARAMGASDSHNEPTMSVREATECPRT